MLSAATLKYPILPNTQYEVCSDSMRQTFREQKPFVSTLTFQFFVPLLSRLFFAPLMPHLSERRMEGGEGISYLLHSDTRENPLEPFSRSIQRQELREETAVPYVRGVSDFE